jgi:hypothetical protein
MEAKGVLVGEEGARATRSSEHFVATGVKVVNLRRSGGDG